MSAITGIFYRDGRTIKPELIKKMNNKLSYRGPDGSSVWVDGSVALGHQMLWTTPESLHEKLPFEEAGLVITADARIDNRAELSVELGIKDEKQVSDSYFILKAYEKWQNDCPSKLLGDFSFVIWDKNEEKLFCARDHMGVKPFYYYLNDKVIFFATEPKALLSIIETPNRLNNIRLADHLVGLFQDREITFYENILRLPAAHTLIIYFNKFNSEKYWELNHNNEIKMESDEEYTKAFLKIFKKAVKCRLRSEFQIGSLLSGGLDSSSIVCTARKILAENGDISLKTFSATFNEVPESDEQYYINKILQFGDLEPYFIKADGISPLSGMDDILWHLEEPLNGHNHYIVYHLFKKAKENDVRIIFDGHGGDNTVLYTERFLIDNFFSFQWKKGIMELIKRSEHLNVNIFTILLRSFLLPLTPIFFIDMIRSLQIGTKGIVENFDLLSKDLIKETDIKKRYDIQQLYPLKSAKKTNDFHYYVLSSGIVQYFLEIKDKMAAAQDLEPRYPFIDRRLIEFCLAIPPEQKNNEGWDRIIMRRAMKDILPFDVQWRQKKTSFDHNFRKRILLEENFINDIIFNHGYLDKRYFNSDSINKTYRNYIDKGISSVKMWRILSLILWLQNINNG